MVALLLNALVVGDPLKPSALVACEQARSRILSGNIEFIVEDRELGRPLGFKARFARNGDMILEQQGDEDGWTHFSYDPGTNTAVPETKIPSYYMRNADGYWELGYTTTGTSLWKQAEIATNPIHEHFHDVRNTGTYFDLSDIRPLPEDRLDRKDDRLTISGWEQKREGTYFVVTGKTVGGYKIEWTIDPDRGWNAERVAAYTATAEGWKLFAESKSTLVFKDGVWFPDGVVYLREGAVAATVVVKQRSFNQAGDSKSFTASDLGVEPGFTIAMNDQQHPVSEALVWSGKELVHADAWALQLRAGAKIGPTLQAQLRGEWSPLYTEAERAILSQPSILAGNPIARRAKYSTVWELYVRRRIEDFRLDAEQTQKAFLILKECETRADRYAEAHSDEFAKYKAAASQPSLSNAEWHEYLSLMGPIQRIFDTELKPRIEKLPTRAQREAASRPTAQAKSGGSR